MHTEYLYCHGRVPICPFCSCISYKIHVLAGGELHDACMNPTILECFKYNQLQWLLPYNNNLSPWSIEPEWERSKIRTGITQLQYYGHFALSDGSYYVQVYYEKRLCTLPQHTTWQQIWCITYEHTDCTHLLRRMGSTRNSENPTRSYLNFCTQDWKRNLFSCT